MTAHRESRMDASRPSATEATDEPGPLSADESHPADAALSASATECTVWEPDGHPASMLLDPDLRNVSTSFLWRGQFDEVAAQRAFDELLMRHGALRTHYEKAADGRVLAISEKRLRVPLSVVDLRETPPHERQAAAFRYRESLIWKRFEIYKGPLVSFNAIRLEHELTAFVVACHHSICDAVSNSLILVELRALYDAALSGSPAQLAPVPMEFADFVRQRAAWLSSPAAEPHLEYWRSVIGGDHGLFRLPADRRTPPPEGYVRPDVTGHVPEDVVTSLRRIASSAQTTLSTAFSAVLAIVLARWSEREEAAAWVCHTGRHRAEHYKVVGCFMDHWLLRVDLSGNPDFCEVVHRVHQRCIEASPHLEITLHRLVPEIARPDAGPPDPSVVLNYIPFAGAGMKAASAPGRVTHWPRPNGGLSKDSPLAMIINCLEFQAEIRWTLTHSSYLFAERTIERFSLALAKTARLLATEPALRMRALEIERVGEPVCSQGAD